MSPPPPPPPSYTLFTRADFLPPQHFRSLPVTLPFTLLYTGSDVEVGGLDHSYGFSDERNRCRGGEVRVWWKFGFTCLMLQPLSN